MPLILKILHSINASTKWSNDSKRFWTSTFTGWCQGARCCWFPPHGALSMFHQEPGFSESWKGWYVIFTFDAWTTFESTPFCTIINWHLLTIFLPAIARKLTKALVVWHGFMLYSISCTLDWLVLASGWCAGGGMHHWIMIFEFPRKFLKECEG